MSIKKTVVRMAVAAVVVAGGAGAVWAQVPIFTSSPAAAGSKFGGDASTSMRVTYEVKREAEIEVTSNNITQADLLKDASYSTYTDNGNLGWLRVKTNSAGWDVAFVTAFGGKLATSEKTLDSVQSGYDFVAGKPTYDYFYKYGPLDFLTYTSKTSTDKPGLLNGGGSNVDTVQLVVGIGMSEIVNNGVKALKGIKYGQQTAPYATPLVAQNDLTGSQSTDNDGTARSGTAVSFAKVLTNSVDGVPASVTATPITVGGVEVKNGATLSDGFGPTNIPNVATNTDADGWEYFYVNVGLPDVSGSVIGGNIEGTYEETFTFTLLASF